MQISNKYHILIKRCHEFKRLEMEKNIKTLLSVTFANEWHKSKYLL